MRPKGLGRGLDALLDGDAVTAGAEAQATVRVDQLERGRYQPRTRMDEASLQDLAASIKAQGLMQPILVRPVNGNGASQNTRYEIIAGERRWRAAMIAGLAEVPVLVRDVADSAALAMALIENIQREDLNPLEEASGVQRLVEEFRLTHQEAAEAIGRSRTATTNLLRLLQLRRPVQQLVLDGKLEMGHARALLGLEGRRQEEVAHRVATAAMSVRQTEQLVHDLLHPSIKTKRRPQTDRDVARLQDELSAQLGTSIEIKQAKGGSGKLVIHYANHEHLDDLLARLKGR
jgi:ParB family chromosome partitioning protein